MSIVSSSFALQGGQVIEDHVDNAGRHYAMQYANGVQDSAAVLTRHAGEISAALIAAECFAILVQDRAPLPLIYATKTDLSNAFKARWNNSSALECGRLAKWVLDRIDDATFTAAQVYTSLGYTLTQWTNTVQPRLAGYRTSYNALLAAVNV